MHNLATQLPTRLKDSVYSTLLKQRLAEWKIPPKCFNRMPDRLHPLFMLACGSLLGRTPALEQLHTSVLMAGHLLAHPSCRVEPPLWVPFHPLTNAKRLHPLFTSLGRTPHSGAVLCSEKLATPPNLLKMQGKWDLHSLFRLPSMPNRCTLSPTLLMAVNAKKARPPTLHLSA